MRTITSREVPEEELANDKWIVGSQVEIYGSDS
jgi:hypothetical protein